MSSAPPAAGDEIRYATREYWEERYASPEMFEWFMSYEAMQPLLDFRKDADVLDIGCGTSRLLFDLRKNGHRGRLVGVDVVPTALEKLRREMCDETVELVVGDCLELDSSFHESSFDVVFDKGTIDALCCGGPDRVRLLCTQISRLLKPGGKFISISHHLSLLDEEEDDDEDDDDQWLSPVIEGLRAEDRSLHLAIHHASDTPTVYIFTTGRHSRRRKENRVSAEVHDHSPS